jgi:hypothetical protein
MFKADHYRKKAADCAETAKTTTVPSEIRELERSQKSFSDLAKNEDWLAENFDKMIHPGLISAKDRSSVTALEDETVAEIEDRILRCLGAAVIMQWSTIPRKLQRELFDTAGSLGDVTQATALRGQIARFLHGHKDKNMPACVDTFRSAIDGGTDGA